jgi:hypothetical protein
MMCCNYPTTTVAIEAERQLKAQGGKPNKLCIEDRLLMGLILLLR